MAASFVRADELGCEDTSPIGVNETLLGELGGGQLERRFELESVDDGVLVLELGAVGGELGSRLEIFDTACRRLPTARVSWPGTSSVHFLPLSAAKKLIISVSRGSWSTRDESFWLRSRLLSEGSKALRTWADSSLAGECDEVGGTGRERISLLPSPDTEDPIDEAESEVMPSSGGGAGVELSSLFQPDVEDPVDEAETEVMPSTGGGAVALLFDREPTASVDETETEVMALAVDEPTLLRVQAEATLGLVALEESTACSATPTAEPVLLRPSRELLAFLRPGEYRLRSLRPVGAGWARPSVEVLPLGPVGETSR
ncbi:MAG: hypothetical protein KDD47_20635 [Acidobacteria bacterium]|nr:hypothetical protein [Acidobacteriota bacterium]